MSSLQPPRGACIEGMLTRNRCTWTDEFLQ